MISTTRQFNGSGDFIDFGNILLANTVVTATQWIKPYQVGSSNFDVSFGYGNSRWFLIWQGVTTSIAFNFKTGGVEKSSGGTTQLTQGQFFLVGGTYDPNAGANNLKVFVYNPDGTQFSTATATATGAIDSTGAHLQIAHDPNRNVYSAMISGETRVYNQVLTTIDFSNLAQQIEPTDINGNIKNPIFRAPLMESWDQKTAYDYSGNLNHGTYNGTICVPGAINRNPTRAPIAFI